MVDFIRQYPNSIPNLLCEDIIQLFETEKDKYKGITINGVNIEIKDTTDFIIPKNNITWSNIEMLLYNELYDALKLFKTDISKPDYNMNNYNKTFSFFGNNELFAHTFMVQKYIKGVGKYIYHDDFTKTSKSMRVITFLWYLNDVEEGGETVFWDNYKIKPEAGKLLLFPATWTYPHTGKMPVSDNKYIITGWLEYNI